MNHLLLDVNIVVDLCLERVGSANAKLAIALAESRGWALWVYAGSVQTLEYVVAAEVIVLVGATPVFVDIEPDTGNIDANLIEAKISPRTKAIMPVSLYGQPADMDAINAIAARHGLPVIEDAAQSFGATYKGRQSGNLSTLGCTSFFPSKPLGCYGDGGAIFTSDDALAPTRPHQRLRPIHPARPGPRRPPGPAAGRRHPHRRPLPGAPQRTAGLRPPLLPRLHPVARQMALVHSHRAHLTRAWNDYFT